MGMRFRKSIRICKGVRVNFGKSGASMSFGMKGLRYTIHTSGRRTASVGIPGTGIYYSESTGLASKNRKRSSTSNARAQKQVAIQQQKDNEYAQNCEAVEGYYEIIDQIRSVHKECSEAIDWSEVQDRPAPFDNRSVGPNEQQAQEALNNLKPSLLGKFVPSVDKKRVENLESALEEGKVKDQQLYSEWKELHNLATKVLEGDIDSYFYVISEMRPFEKILDFGSDFDIGTDCSDFIEVEFHAKTDQIVPDQVLSLTKTGKLSSKSMTKTMHFDIAQDYICSCVLRVARETFALLPIEIVIIHAMDRTETGEESKVEDTVLSVLIHREQLNSICFESTDASDTVEMFDCNMNFKKTKGLQPVSRIAYSK